MLIPIPKIPLKILSFKINTPKINKLKITTKKDKIINIINKTLNI